MLILASASNARRRLLDKLGINYKVMISGINEDIDSLGIKETVQVLAELKAKNILSKISSNNFENLNKEYITSILGCDSMFESNGCIYGKPKNEEEAIARLRKLSSSYGILHTGHCFLYGKNLQTDFQFNSIEGIFTEVKSTKINFVQFNDKDINSYVKSGEPMKCAGGFSLEGKGSVFISSIEGCYSNVIGLSLPWLKSSMERADLYFSSIRKET